MIFSFVVLSFFFSLVAVFSLDCCPARLWAALLLRRAEIK